MTNLNADYYDAWLAISAVKARYCRMLDTKQWDQFSRLFTDDFVLDVEGVDPIEGREAAMAFIQSALATARTVHQIHIPHIELDGEEADVIWPMQDRNTWEPARNGVATQRGFGHYRERYVRIDGEWKIAAQNLSYLHLDFNQL